MLLIIFLGLFAKLALVSGDCEDGPRNVTNFDFPTATGTWYGLYHSNNTFDNSFECVKGNFGCPDGNTSLITLQGVDKSTKESFTVNGNATNWNSTGYWDQYFGPSQFYNGRYCVLAYDYERYMILQRCSSVSTEQDIYVLFRCKQPDDHTVKEVKEKLKCLNIDINKLLKWWTGTCHHEVSSTERGSSTEPME